MLAKKNLLFFNISLLGLPKEGLYNRSGEKKNSVSLSGIKVITRPDQTRPDDQDYQVDQDDQDYQDDQDE